MKSIGIDQLSLRSYPFGPDQKVFGTPEQRIAVLTEQGENVHGVWDCSAGGFEITFGWEEFAYVLEGEVRITGAGSEAKTLRAGDLAHFKKGNSYRWDIPTYLKKTFTVIVEGI